MADKNTATTADKPPANPATTVKLRKVVAIRNHECKIKSGPRGVASSYTEYKLVKGETYEMPQEHIDLLNQQANSSPDPTVRVK